MDIVDLFAQNDTTFQRELQFEVVALFVVILFIFTYYFNNNYAYIIILLAFTLYILNIWVGVRQSNVYEFNKMTMYKLQKIQVNVNKSIDNLIMRKFKISKHSILSGKNGLSKKQLEHIYEKHRLESFYIDANMIHFVDSISVLYDYNDLEYLLFVKGINNILRIRREMEEYYEENNEVPINASEMFEIALQLRTNTINNLHNFIYSVPKINVMYNYIDDIVKRYIVLITRNTDIIHDYYKLNIKQRGINCKTKFVSYETTKPYDAKMNHSIINTKKNSFEDSLIPFYL